MAVVIVAGALANKPGNGGEAWVRLSWVGARHAGSEAGRLETRPAVTPIIIAMTAREAIVTDFCFWLLKMAR